MATLVRAPEDLDAEVRASAARQGQPLNTWWVDAARQKLHHEKIDIAAIADKINSDPIMREVMDRLAQ